MKRNEGERFDDYKCRRIQDKIRTKEYLKGQPATFHKSEHRLVGGTLINIARQKRKELCEKFGVTMKQLRKRKIYGN